MLLPQKAEKDICAKAALLWSQKCLGKLTPDVEINK
jgi:hypothetical protein